MADVQGRTKIRSKATPQSAPAADSGGATHQIKNSKYYEQTQHLVENKKGHLGEPSKYWKISWLPLGTPACTG
jgi:hypothetical protein